MNAKENICVNKTTSKKSFLQTNKHRSHVILPTRKSPRVAETSGSRLEFKATRVSSSSAPAEGNPARWAPGPSLGEWA